MSNVSNLLKLAAIGTYFIAFALSEPQMIMRHSVFMVMATCFVGMLRFTRTPITTGLAALGRQTYSLYFSHLLLTTWVYNVIIARAGLGLAANFTINVIVCFPLTIIASHFIFNPIDNHALGYIVKRYRVTHLKV